LLPINVATSTATTTIAFNSTTAMFETTATTPGQTLITNSSSSNVSDVVQNLSITNTESTTAMTARKADGLKDIRKLFDLHEQEILDRLDSALVCHFRKIFKISCRMMISRWVENIRLFDKDIFVLFGVVLTSLVWCGNRNAKKSILLGK
jgi:hypothetical protein